MRAESTQTITLALVEQRSNTLTRATIGAKGRMGSGQSAAP
jgi:hypothetical protein